MIVPLSPESSGRLGRGRKGSPEMKAAQHTRFISPGRPEGRWAAERVLGLCLLSVVALAPFPLEAQEGRGECDVPSHQGFLSRMLPNGTRVLYFSRPVMRCPGGIRITADSAVVYEQTRYNQLFGNVVFTEGDQRLGADEAQYFEREGRLVAWGRPVLTDQAEGSVIRGDTMVFIRAGEWQPEDRLTVTGRRPHATLYPARRPAPDEPTTVPPDTLPALPPDTLPPPDSLALPPPDTLPRPRPGVGDPAVPDTLPPPDSLAFPPPDTAVAPAREAPREPAEPIPYEIYAQRIVLEGSRYFRATGSVEITRDSLDATAESVELDQEDGLLTLRDGARVKTSSTDLAADTIRLDLPEDEIREVFARGHAVLEGEDVRVLAPIISLFLSDGRLERLVAVRDPVADAQSEALGEMEPPPDRPGPLTLLPAVVRELNLPEFPRQPLALAEDFRLTGDSLEILAPGEVLDELWAMGRARGEATGRDSLNTEDTPSILLVDWLEGDTIVASFTRVEVLRADVPEDTLAVGDRPDLVLPDTLRPEREPLPWGDQPEAQADSVEARYRLERLTARVAARSLYRMEPSDSTAKAEGLLAVHYVIGDEIVIIFNQGEIERMEVENARGTHLEPVARPRRAEEPTGGERPPGTGAALPTGAGDAPLLAAARAAQGPTAGSPGLSRGRSGWPPGAGGGEGR
jgi:lipopolysaccharide export system protein LptA